MDVSLILKIAGVGVIAAVSAQIVSKTGRDEITPYITVAGIITVLAVLLGEIGALISSVKSIFGL